jgi:2-hydroxy-6-oxonona-2,4-dienedioate hydrolase
MNGSRCILLDRPGTGLSDAVPGVLDVDALSALADALVVDVLDALGLDSAHLVATSFGGYYALRGAAAHPDRVDRIVEFSWPVGAPIARIPMFMRMASAPGLGRLLVALPPNERAVRMMFRRIGHGPSLKAGRIAEEMVSWYVALLRHTRTMRNEAASGRLLMSPVRGLSQRLVLSDDLLARVTHPTYLLWGENDPFGGPETARALAERLPNAELEIMAGAGHAPWLDDPDRCAEITGRFSSP